MIRRKNPTIYRTWDEAPAILTTWQAAILLQCHFNTIKNVVADGRLHAVKVGNGWRVEKETLRAMFDGEATKARGALGEPNNGR